MGKDIEMISANRNKGKTCDMLDVSSINKSLYLLIFKQLFRTQ